MVHDDRSIDSNTPKSPALHVDVECVKIWNGLCVVMLDSGIDLAGHSATMLLPRLWSKSYRAFSRTTKPKLWNAGFPLPLFVAIVFAIFPGVTLLVKNAVLEPHDLAAQQSFCESASRLSFLLTKWQEIAPAVTSCSSNSPARLVVDQCDTQSSCVPAVWTQFSNATRLLLHSFINCTVTISLKPLWRMASALQNDLVSTDSRSK